MITKMQYIYIYILLLYTSACSSQKYDKIIIISEENSKKNEVAELINIAKHKGAKIIGLNFDFKYEDSIGDSLLKKAIQDCPNLIIPTFDINIDSNKFIAQNQHYNYQGADNIGNYIVSERNKAIYFDAILTVGTANDNLIKTSYALELAFQYDSLQVGKFLEKRITPSKDFTVKIEYSGNQNMFQVISKKDIFSGNYPKDILDDFPINWLKN
jgi:hypothetical protein